MFLCYEQVSLQVTQKSATEGPQIDAEEKSPPEGVLPSKRKKSGKWQQNKRRFLPVTISNYRPGINRLNGNTWIHLIRISISHRRGLAKFRGSGRHSVGSFAHLCWPFDAGDDRQLTFSWSLNILPDFFNKVLVENCRFSWAWSHHIWYPSWDKLRSFVAPFQLNFILQRFDLVFNSTVIPSKMILIHY